MADVIEMKDYFTPGADRERIDKAREALKGVKYDTMVGRGMSGALVVPMLAKALRKNWLIVRKPGEHSHSYDRAVGKLGHRWVFVDDFIASGDTLEATKDAVRQLAEYRDFDTEYVGQYLYKDTNWAFGFRAAA